MKKEKWTLREAFANTNVGMRVIEDIAGLPHGIISQYVNGSKKCSDERLKLIQQAFQTHSKKTDSFELIQG